MALSSIIGRASSPVLPLAIRTVGLGSLRSFHGDIATAINVHERTILSPKNSFQCHSYSSAASPSLAKKLLDENLIRIINSEIKTHKLNPVSSYQTFIKFFLFNIPTLFQLSLFCFFFIYQHLGCLNIRDINSCIIYSYG